MTSLVVVVVEAEHPRHDRGRRSTMPRLVPTRPAQCERAPRALVSTGRIRPLPPRHDRPLLEGQAPEIYIHREALDSVDGRLSQPEIAPADGATGSARYLYRIIETVGAGSDLDT